MTTPKAAFRAEDEDCARCAHPRSRHIDRASLPDSEEPCDEDGCPCTEFEPSGRKTDFWDAP